MSRAPAPSAAPEPAGKSTLFCLLCPQRSGSNALSSLLNATGRVALYGQLFANSREYRAYNAADLGLPLFRAPPDTARHYGLRPPLSRRAELLSLRATRRARDVEDYVKRFRARMPDAPAVGFKLHDFQLEDADFLRMAGNVDRTVLLWRRNLLRAAVSWAYAVRTNLWVSHGAPAKPRTVTLDPREVAWFIEKTQNSVARWRRLLDEAGRPWTEITYEEHVAPRRLEGLFDVLGLGDAPIPDFATRRIAGRDYAHVANAREIDAALGSDRTGRLFEAP
ncbi:hypothetical protein [Citreimonas sp.]|uniref:hypothetical protein n=1 Tax=Citreimonas sp. TaxID=3036715 RepID=UPI00405A062E